MIRVLIVDDSAFMRKALSIMLEGDPEVEVVGTARDGLEAIEKVRELKPDIVTLDVEMPRMDGLTALRRIMREHPVPVIMVSSLTQEGAQATIEALEAGAVDFIPKQHSYVSIEISRIRAELLEKIKTIARTRPLPTRRRSAAPGTEALPAFRFREARAIAIGVSTGGPRALQQVIPALPADLPVPVLIVQHMPPHFTRSLAERLNSLSPLTVVEAEEGMPLEPGRVFLAPGGRHLVLERRNGHVPVIRTPVEPATLHRPSVDVMFQSVCQAFGGKVLAVVMTGMGRDGLEGARLIKQHGGKVITQDEATCVVYGMPRAVAEAGLSDAVLPLEQIGPFLARSLGCTPVAQPVSP
ncbi:protein-glutamate methylesterase/protein-glutamine glutaminase [Rhodothermus marinus]|uniref:protein-glutamate methylesterase/protein-glutamine glutaminase n=1 Tax=Rhodothermus marinus TaxID=29549 RepID=UPI0012BA4420|nr:chemotaxis response regulator protein-glutamate methylesterase [Rhodothermus marinus]BBM68956.1 chemotaxis response regulator protein-glutamate methylesterase [Rhodothermus marinus]BBM71934.1 chemotaxis response regulator protein-glutamate methylesterase [Rhodothermus marinus]